MFTRDRVLRTIGGLFFTMALDSGFVGNAAWANSETTGKGASWGVGIGLRHARVAMDAPDHYTSDVVPLLYYEGERLFLDGIEGGIRLFDDSIWRVNALARIRFFDKPQDTHDDVQSDARDVGLQVRRTLSADHEARVEALSAGNGRHYVDVGIQSQWGDEFSSVRPYLGLRLKSSRFNDHYLGLDQEEIGAGIDLRATVDGRVHLTSNLYLIGGAGVTWLDGTARRNPTIRDDFTWEAFAGVGIFDDPRRPNVSAHQSDDYLRVAWGWATPSNIGEIIRLETESDPDNNSLSSLFYGHYLTDQVLGIPLDIYMTVGFLAHHRSRVQERGAEYVAGIKAYRAFNWPTRGRIGIAEGFSYVNRITHVERTEMQRKRYRPSKLLNYLDLSIDVNVGELLRKPSWRHLWFGYGIHHRSGMFESGSQFGEIHGGSNYRTLYLQTHF